MAESSLRRRRSPRRGPFTSIAWQQATLGVAAAVLLSLLFGALQIVAEYHRSSEEFERLTQEISAGISPFAAQAVVGDDHVMARKVTRALIRHPLILKASMVHRPSGYPLAESGTGKQHTHERRRMLLLLLGDEEVEQSLPIRNRAGEVIGELRLSIDRGWIASRSLDQALSTFSSNLFEDLLLATLLVALLNRMVIRPVSNIIARINRVDPSNPRPLTAEAGDPPVDDEVGTLLSATNRLLADIRRQFRARQEGERRIQQLLDSTAEGIIGFDPEMRGTFINREALRMLGLTEEEVVGRPLEQWLGWMESEECRLWDVLDSRGAGERSQSGTATFRHRDGSRFPVEYWLTPLANPDNRAQGVVLSFVDITEKQRILLQLEDSERELRAIFEGMHDIYYRLDAEGRIVRMTPSAERLFGYPVEELIGRNAREFYLHPPVLEELVRRLRAEGEVTDFEAQLRHRDGHPVWVSIHARLLRDESGREIGREGMLHDIQHIKEAEEALLHYAEFEHLVASISADFLRIQPGGLEGRVHAALDELARFTRTGHAAVFRIGEQNQEARLMMEWSESGKPLFREVPRPLAFGLQFPWLARRLTDGRAIALPDLSHLPARAGEELRWLKRHRIVALLAVPLNYAGHLHGFLLVSSDRPREWQQEEISILQVFAEVLINAIVRTETESELQRSKENLEIILNSSPDPFLLLTDDLTVVQSNHSAEVILATPSRELCGIPFLSLAATPQSRKALSLGFETLLKEGESALETVIRTASGTVLPMDIRVRRLSSRLQENGASYLVVLRDISERKEFEARLEYQAKYDSLTRIANRSLMRDRLEQELHRCQRHGCYGALLFLDLDHFKHINDSLGHPVGDALLVHIAQRLTDSVRKEDVAARLGGDEFVLILGELGQSEEEAAIHAQATAEKIQRVIAQPLLIGDHELQVGSSIGIAIFSPSHSDPDEVLKQADTAMYKSKESGRGSFSFFLPSMQRAAEQRLRLQNALRRAISQGEIHPWFQPRMDEEGRLLGAEALARWHHARQGVIPPADFIPLAEESGLILTLGEIMLRESVNHFARFVEEGLEPGTLSVNVSMVQFRHPDFVMLVLGALRENRLPPERLEIELTESLFLHEPEEASARIEQLRAEGVRFSIDDFGTGYSSLGYLKKLSLDTLKIDRSFVRDIAVDPNDLRIIETIIGMARHLHLQVVAEGVETEEQLEILQRCGCHQYQGYLFHHPMPAEEFQRLLLKAC